MTERTVVGTGHRPPRLGGYHLQSKLDEFAREIIDELLCVDDVPLVHGISGMALGWDQALARAFDYSGIDWTAAIPCLGQDRTWPLSSQEEYARLLTRATHVHMVTNGPYEPWTMIARDRWMVDQAIGPRDRLLALWDGDKRGGTWDTISYAEKHSLERIDLWERWVEWKSK